MHSTLFFALACAYASTVLACTCVVTEYSKIPGALAKCTDIVLQDIAAPSNGTIDLSKAKKGSVITFAGTTTFAFTNSSDFIPMKFGGKNITIRGTPDSIIDGNGPMYWDGLGSNGGLPKPNHLIAVKMNDSLIENLQLQNWPVRAFKLGNSRDVTIRNIYLDNTLGDLPNDLSGGKNAAHNSDAFGVGTKSKNILIHNCTVYNQDDCVAVTSADNVTVSNLYCSGTHGLSIGSIGGKSYNNVTNILFTDSYLRNSTNGARIKSNFNTTGYVANITYSNIQMFNISDYGIVVQQDYLNGGPTGTPSNGVIIENVLFKNITGTVTSDGISYYVLCGTGCKNFVFEDVKITGGKPNSSSCNFPASGCPLASYKTYKSKPLPKYPTCKSPPSAY
ncbi:uncharacterized protein L3040_003857 [Drepanopeziza brunnea f. sp. 'multigermtubi']|uniref:endo-polygalacturonase n=1 Tax=Marssonina brunnea f. sp. multigermtubi (strain MB_m1) TaxID=1072389 RepID=K1XQQ1_MARBU|nr:neutral endopolygalacturonase SSPG6 [Drepanopeziza brunnea f. sp. 'multigermtubi' MB_m1]EKD14929.1 neutral endopolygalacturonase SSPG6 [Drepanopeziza brunnea f. sp. 'multigermtubi' MB_m1]KAJ5046619.1 hypothetical protein L3040_003857 [Drepanopeziza brunnea f. sp. 'multigermtubi']